MTTVRKYRPSDNPSATACLKVAFRDDPLLKKMASFSKDEWEVAAERMFSWGNYMLAASYDMTEVVVDDKTGDIHCVAQWELPYMTIMFGLRGLLYMIYVFCMYYNLILCQRAVARKYKTNTIYFQYFLTHSF